MRALFVDGMQISRPYNSEDEAWHEARKAGLADGDKLEAKYEIKRLKPGSRGQFLDRFSDARR
jgi:hypothetical protein